MTVRFIEKDEDNEVDSSSDDDDDGANGNTVDLVNSFNERGVDNDASHVSNVNDESPPAKVVRRHEPSARDNDDQVMPQKVVETASTINTTSASSPSNPLLRPLRTASPAPPQRSPSTNGQAASAILQKAETFLSNSKKTKETENHSSIQSPHHSSNLLARAASRLSVLGSNSQTALERDNAPPHAKPSDDGDNLQPTWTKLLSLSQDDDDDGLSLSLDD